MANRSFHRHLGSLEIDVVTLYAKFAVGASGAPTLDTSNSKGVASVTRDSAGQYTLLFSDYYQRLLWADAKLFSTSASNPTTDGVGFRLEADALSTAKTCQVQFFALDDGAAADVLDGQVVYMKFELRNSTVG